MQYLVTVFRMFFIRVLSVIFFTFSEFLIDEEEEEIEVDETKLPEDFETQHLETDIENSNSNVDLSDSIQMLKDHGISFLPADNSSVVASAVENGHSLVLTGNELPFNSIAYVVLSFYIFL